MLRKSDGVGWRGGETEMRCSCVIRGSTAPTRAEPTGTHTLFQVCNQRQQRAFTPFRCISGFTPAALLHPCALTFASHERALIWVFIIPTHTLTQARVNPLSTPSRDFLQQLGEGGEGTECEMQLTAAAAEVEDKNWLCC